MTNNYLKATIINTFLDILANADKLHSQTNLLSPEGLNEAAGAVYTDIVENCSTCPKVEAALNDLKDAFSKDYVFTVISQNRRTSPFTMADIEQADALGADISSCPCTPDFSNTPILKASMDTADYTGYRVSDDISLAKAKKGTPEYDDWLAKYRARRGPAKEPVKKEVAKETLHKEDKNPNTLRARKAKAGITTATKTEVRAALSTIDHTGSKTVNIAGVDVTVHSDEESVMLQAKPMNGGSRTVCTINSPLSDLKANDYDVIARSLNKLVNGYPDEFLPKPGAEEMDS